MTYEKAMSIGNSHYAIPLISSLENWTKSMAVFISLYTFHSQKTTPKKVFYRFGKFPKDGETPEFREKTLRKNIHW